MDPKDRAESARTCPVHGWTLMQKYRSERRGDMTLMVPTDELWCRSCGYNSPVAGERPAEPLAVSSLTPEDQAAFVSAILNPPEPNDALRRAAVSSLPSTDEHAEYKQGYNDGYQEALRDVKTGRGKEPSDFQALMEHHEATEAELQATKTAVSSLQAKVEQLADEVDTLCLAIEGHRGGALTNAGLWHYHEKARAVLKLLASSLPEEPRP